jgi:hypothetical protein
LWLAVHEMRGLEMITTSTLSMCTKDNCRNWPPAGFGRQKFVHRTNSVKNMAVEQRHVFKFFSDKSMPRVQIVARLGQHSREGALSRTEIYFWIDEAKRGERILILLRTPEESVVKILRPLVLASSLPILTFQPGSLHSPWELQPQQFVDT